MQAGAKYLADQRGAFTPSALPACEDAVAPARAPLYELAAAHDGQPAGDWLRVFLGVFGLESN